MTNQGIINSYNEIHNFFLFLKGEYEAAATEANLASTDLVLNIKADPNKILGEIKEDAKNLLDREPEKLVEESNIDKEILDTLPKKGIRANTRYAERVLEIASKYYIYEDMLYNEIKARYEGFLDKKPNSTLDVNEQVNSLEEKIYLLNEYNTPYEKIGLDRDILILRYYYKRDLSIVNNAIADAITKFRESGIPISLADFNYNKYVTEYLAIFLDKFEKNELDNPEIKSKFEEIYWKCPELITYIELNLQYIYSKNERKIEKNLEEKKQELFKEFPRKEVVSKYNQYRILAIENDLNDAKKIVDNFRSGKLKVKDYTRDAISKSVAQYTGMQTINEEDTEKVCQDLVKLMHSLEEYQGYLKFKPIIDEVIATYKEKSKYKNSYSQLKKQIDKSDNKILKLNFGIFSRNSLPKQTEIALETKNLYKQLSIEKVYQTIANKLNDNSTIFDVLNLASSFYEYLFTHIINKDKNISDEQIVDQIEDLIEFVKWPYFNILNNINILEEKDIAFIIKDRYNLLNINISREDLDESNLGNIIETLKKVQLFYYIYKNNINLDDLEDELELKAVLDSKR